MLVDNYFPSLFSQSLQWFWIFVNTFLIFVGNKAFIYLHRTIRYSVTPDRTPIPNSSFTGSKMHCVQCTLLIELYSRRVYAGCVNHRTLWQMTPWPIFSSPIDKKYTTHFKHYEFVSLLWSNPLYNIKSVRFCCFECVYSVWYGHSAQCIMEPGKGLLHVLRIAYQGFG